MRAKLTFVFFLLLLIGCSTSTTSNSPPTTYSPPGESESEITQKWSKVRVGMTKDQITQILGKPTGIQYSSSGESWSYSDPRAIAGGITFNLSDQTNTVSSFSSPSF
ncbi:MAG: outer membrane protein assembly factor BamE [Planctomycetes bacterium]|nr:outer membrane protein assembly factor BamE [Planctomycetota bacterium]